MNKGDCGPLAFTTAVNTLAVAIAQKLLMMNDTPMPLAETASTFNEALLIAQLLKDATPEEELTLLTAVLAQLTGSLTTIAVQRSLCGKSKEEQTS